MPGTAEVVLDLDRRIGRDYPEASPLVPCAVPVFPDAMVVEGTVPRPSGEPIRRLHALVRMHA